MYVTTSPHSSFNTEEKQDYFSHELHGNTRMEGSGDDKVKGNPVIAGMSRNLAPSGINSNYNRP
jgi:hypothetical protein